MGQGLGAFGQSSVNLASLFGLPCLKQQQQRGDSAATDLPGIGKSNRCKIQYEIAFEDKGGRPHLQFALSWSEFSPVNMKSQTGLTSNGTLGTPSKALQTISLNLQSPAGQIGTFAGK